jgi:hypothetical protein
VTSDEQRESLATELERHADEDGSILAQYRVLAERPGDSAAGMLVDQILTDEEIHHLLLRTMATWLRGRGGPGTAPIPVGANRNELLRLTQALHAHEGETIEACRALRPRLSGERAELIDTLLEVMALDSEKHQRLLTAVQGLLRR